MRIAFDSNLLIYLARVWKVQADRDKTARLDKLMVSFLDDVKIVLPYQALGEAYRVMLAFGFSREQCRETLQDWVATFEAAPSGTDAFSSAINLATDHKLQFWDALIVSVAADAQCQLLLSEDLQHGFTWHGVTIINPLAVEMDHRLTRLLSTPQ